MMQMERVKLPTLPYELSRVCFGTAQFGVSISREKAFALLDRFYAMGGNFIDTANVYGRWAPGGLNRGEQIIGEWLRTRGVRDVIVATKGCHFAPLAPSVSRVNERCARADAEESLRTLGLSVLPLYWLHRDDESRPVEEIVEFCEQMRRDGWILRYGFSNYRAHRVRAALAYADRMGYERIFAVSNEWSLAEEHGAPFTDPSGMVLMDGELFSLHRTENLPVIPFTAAAHGYFARLDAGAALPPSLSRFDTAENRALLSRLRELAAETGADVPDIAVAYLLNTPLSAIPIVSTSDEDHLASFARIASLRFPTEELRAFY
ncbi:MAG: aldo/keto reductase [Eubacteriales bacterium]